MLALLFGCAFMIGYLDAICGGGGLLTVPLLLSLGFDPAHAFATNKLQGVFGTGSSTFTFARSGILDIRAMAPAIPCVAIGAACGTLTVQHVDPAILRPIIPLFLIAVALYFMLMRPAQASAGCLPLIGMRVFAPFVAGGIAFYDGLLGLGTGAFFVAAISGLLGQELRRATAHTKLLNFASNLGSLLFFVLGGKVVWAAGLAMATGQIIGATLGAYTVLARGAQLVRSLVVIAALAMAVRLLVT